MSDRTIFDPDDPEHAKTGVPFGELAILRRDCPVARTPGGAWFLSRREEIDQVLLDVESFGSDMTPGTGIDGVENVPEQQLFLPEIDEPRHGQIRRLFNSALGVHRTQKIAPFVRDTCERLIDGFAGAAEPDLHSAYAMPIPSHVIAHIMGLPVGAPEKLIEWSFNGSVMFRPASPLFAPEGPPIHAYLTEWVAEERAKSEPSSHTVRVFLKAEIGGRRLSDVEIAHQLQTMVLGGVHTTRGLLAHCVERLILMPGLFDRLQEQRDLVKVFVEESLRHDSPAHRVTRRCLKDARVGDVNMTRGDWLSVSLASANRDETRYDESDEFRLDRPDPREHIAFGGGPHICPGASLARLEANTAVEALLDRFSAMEPVAGVTYPPMPANLSYQPLPAQLTPR